jgi:hypothetical protein
MNAPKQALTFMIFSGHQATREQFVLFWSRQYNYKPALEALYDDNIGIHADPKERIRQLFKWKNGGNLSDDKSQSVETNFVARLGELAQCSDGEARQSMLARFSKGGAIFRIFFLHCWNQGRYPIFDQHVYRAMSYIKTGKPAELPDDDDLKVRIYLDEFLPFLDEFVNNMEARQVDRALWTFGKFVKTYPKFG